jgi:hypothetical protein
VSNPSGDTNLRAIAGGLTARGIKTVTGGTRWHPEQVAAVLRLTDAQMTSALESKSVVSRQCL